MCTFFLQSTPTSRDDHVPIGEKGQSRGDRQLSHKSQAVCEGVKCPIVHKGNSASSEGSVIWVIFHLNVKLVQCLRGYFLVEMLSTFGFVA